MDNKKVASLLNKGMKFDSLKMLNETQIDTLYNSLIGEEDLNQRNQEADMLLNKLGQIEDKLSELGEDDVDNIEPFKGQQTQDPKQVGPSTDDGMGNYQDGMDEGEVTEKVKNEEIRQIEESLVSLVKKYVSETMTKKDLMNLLESPGTKEAPVKTPTRTKPERKTPYKPKHKPAPKAADTEVAPTRVKPGTKEKPGRKTPYQPKHKPAPKAGKKGLPEFLKFNTLNIQFRDEQEN